MENSKKLTQLLQETSEHLDDKRYIYTSKKAEMKGSGRNKKPKIDGEGNIIYLKGKFNPGTPHKMVFLSFAFNMALENYQNIRKPYTAVRKIEKLSNLSEMLIRYFSNKYYKDLELKSDQDKTDKKENWLIDNSENYDYQMLVTFQDIEYKLYAVIERLRNYHSHYLHEPGILSFKDLFDTEETLSQEGFNEAKSWFQKRFDDAHNHLTESLVNRKEKINKQIDDEPIEGRKEILRKKIKQIDGVLAAFNNIKLLEDNKLTIEGQLFIAGMFLSKRQAKLVLDKWRGYKGKEIQGYSNSLHTLFTYYSLSERYSLNNYNDDQMKFRDITSKLSTIPYSTNPQLLPIYQYIKNDINNVIYEKIDAYPDGLEIKIANANRLLKRNKSSWKEKEKARKNIVIWENELEELRASIIPLRKKPIVTDILLQYIVDNDMLNEKFQIAIKKDLNDKLDYYENNKEYISVKESLTTLKERVILERKKKNLEKSHILNEHLKELKRNFVFKTIKELNELSKPQEILDPKTKEKIIDKETGEPMVKDPRGYNFTTKKNNALIQYQYKDGKGNDSYANISFSPDLLLKIVFLHLTRNNNKAMVKIEEFILNRIILLQEKNAKEIVDFYSTSKAYKKIPLKRIIPISIRQSIEENINTDYAQKIKENIQDKIKNLEDFQRDNKQQAKSWKYASKRKIDAILQYMHFCLLSDVYFGRVNLKTENAEDFIRHKSFNMNTYNLAREYFRYFGRYKNDTIDQLDSEKQEIVLPYKITELKKEHKLLFSYVTQEINDAHSLEDVFEAVSEKQLNLYKDLLRSYSAEKHQQYMMLFKINKHSEKANVNKLLKTQYVKSFALSADLISIGDYFGGDYYQFTKTKRELLKKKGKEFHFSDFSFIRQYLSNEFEKPYTNIDFILQNIMPQIIGDEEKSKEVLNKNGKIKPSIFKKLLAIKTQELVLWNIAKSYWEKANEQAKYKIDNLKLFNANSFQELCTFNKVYQQDLDYSIKIDKKFWEKENGKNKQKFKTQYEQLSDNKEFTYTLKIPAKKYDNKFLSVETKLITEYLLWNHFKAFSTNKALDGEYRVKGVNRTYNLNVYEDLMKVIYKELSKSIVYIGDLLAAEKNLVDRNRDKFINLLEEKYKDKHLIVDFFLSIRKGEQNPQDLQLYNAFYNSALDKQKHVIDDYFVNFRNFALHYQLQNPKTTKIVLELLKYINKRKVPKQTTSEE